jgi:L-fuculose-phosphate aldolase
MSATEQELRDRLAKVGKLVWDAGLTYSSSGNISARIPGTTTCLIKPSGFRLGELKPEDFIVIDIYTRKVVKGDHKPSVEVPFHTTMYKRREDVGGVVHTHSHYATILSILGVELVPMGMGGYETPALMKGVGVAEYALAGTDELAANAAEGMGERCAVLLPHHGAIAIGKTIEEAYDIAKGVEDLAKLQYEVMQIGKPNPLPDFAVKALLERGESLGLIV